MEFQEVLKVSGTILGLLGGGASIVFYFSSWLGKVWADRLMAKDTAKHAEYLAALRNSLTQEIESYKIKLKKSELIFQKEFEAASEFVAIFRSFTPTYSRPQMDKYEFCDCMAHNFHKIEVTLALCRFQWKLTSTGVAGVAQLEPPGTERSAHERCH